MNCDYMAINIEFRFQALDNIAVLEPHALAGVQAEKSALRSLPEVVTFYPQFAREWNQTGPSFGMMWMHGRVTFLNFGLWKVVDYESERVENGECTRRLVVEVISKGTFQDTNIDPPVDLGYSDALA